MNRADPNRADPKEASAPMAAANEYPIERWKQTIERAYAGSAALEDLSVRGAVEGVIAALDAGHLRVAEKVVGPAYSESMMAGSTPATAGSTTASTVTATATWITHGWIQQAISLYFRLRVSETIIAGPFEFHDKIPL